MYSLPHSVGALALLNVDIMGQYPPASPPGPEFADQSLNAFGGHCQTNVARCAQQW